MPDSHHQRRLDLSPEYASFGAAEDASPDTAEAAEEAEGASSDAADRPRARLPGFAL